MTTNLIENSSNKSEGCGVHKVASATIAEKTASFSGVKIPENRYLVDVCAEGEKVYVQYPIVRTKGTNSDGSAIIETKKDYRGKDIPLYDWSEPEEFIVTDGLICDMDVRYLYTNKFMADEIYHCSLRNVQVAFSEVIPVCRIRQRSKTNYENCYNFEEVADAKQQQIASAQELLNFTRKAAESAQRHLDKTRRVMGDCDDMTDDFAFVQSVLNNFAIGVAAQQALLGDKIATGGVNADDIRDKRNKLIVQNIQNFLPTWQAILSLGHEERLAILDMSKDKKNTQKLFDTIDNSKELFNEQDRRKRIEEQLNNVQQELTEHKDKLEELEDQLADSTAKLDDTKAAYDRVTDVLKITKPIELYSKPSGEDSKYCHHVDREHGLQTGMVIRMLKAQGILDKISTTWHAVPATGYEHFFVEVYKSTISPKGKVRLTEIPALSAAGLIYVKQAFKDCGIPDTEKGWDGLFATNDAAMYWAYVKNDEE